MAGQTLPAYSFYLIEQNFMVNGAITGNGLTREQLARDLPTWWQAKLLKHAELPNMGYFDK